jgi:UDPglucose--hexose-1-phosphate uridylyltransferase
MSEFRQNLATKEWVILAPGRTSRPHDSSDPVSVRAGVPRHRPDCPFCLGNEAQTNDAVLICPVTGDWQVRVVPNKFAALQPQHDPTRLRVGAFLSAQGYGVAEVVIEHPRHDLSPAFMTLDEVANILRAYRQRQEELSKLDKINLVTIFRNWGARAGTSLEHPHSQIIATPIVPPHVRYPLEQAVMHYDETGRCVYCDMIDEERRQGNRMVIESENFVAFCPFASRSPFESRIYPKRHQPSFYLISDEDLTELALVLREMLGRLHLCLNDPDYNYIIRSAPVGDQDTKHLHWYIVMIPKLSTAAGFEIGSGIYINTTAPETAAERLRAIKLP